MESAKKIVVKVGTSTLTYPTGLINLRKIEKLVKCISDMQNSGKKMILVSSGAVSAGMGKIGMNFHALSTQDKQAASAVGQCELINMYNTLFSQYGHTVAQILLTKDVVEDGNRCSNAKGTFKTLIERGCIPVVNENDTVSSEQIKFGSNDTLSAIVAQICEADLLINLTDIDGLYTSDPRIDKDAKIVKYVDNIEEAMKYAGDAGSARGTGGMRAKLEAAKICTSVGIPMIIANGADPEILYDIAEGRSVGTYIDVKKV